MQNLSKLTASEANFYFPADVCGFEAFGSALTVIVSSGLLEKYVLLLVT